MSLTSCLQKAGTALRQEDKTAILASARRYRAEGLRPDAAGIKAIDEQLAAVKAKIATEQARVDAHTKATEEAAAAAQEEKKKDDDAAGAAEPAAPTKIEDAGAKIGGARKDRWKERGLDLSDLDAMSESEGAEMATKANVWKPDYEAIAAANEPVTAALVKTIYDQLAAQPKDNTPAGRRRYVTMMQAIRSVYGNLEALKGAGDVQAVFNKARNELIYGRLKFAEGRYGDNEQAKENAKGVQDLAAHMAEAKKTLFSVYKGRSEPFSLGYREMVKARALVQAGFPAKAEPWTKRLTVREEGGSGGSERAIEALMRSAAEVGTPLTLEQAHAPFWRVIDKTGKTVAYLTSKADAEAAAKSIYERDLKSGPAEKPEPNRPHLDTLKRENLPARLERDATAEDFVKDFGFRGIEFGNWAAQDERQRIINMAYDGLMDLAHIMGVPPKALSLNGTMGMAFGARGGGRFAAHYEPGKLVINMTKLQGGGSMAHEWAHALDHYFGELNQPDAYTTKARGASGWYSEGQYRGTPITRTVKVDGAWKHIEKMRLDNMRPEMAKAFDTVMSALFSGQESKAQMVRGAELSIERTLTAANSEQDPETKARYQRSLESQRQALAELVQDPEDKTYPKGRSDFARQGQLLSGKSANGYWTRPTEMFARAFESWVFDKVAAMGARSDYLVHGVEADRFAGGQYKGNPYPAGAERATINAAFDKLAATIQTKEGDDGKVAMFSRTPQVKAAYDTRIDQLFAGAQPGRVGVRVLDRSDLLGLLGYKNWPVNLVESKVVQGIQNHNLTAAEWKKVPQWLDHPAMVFDSDTVPGRLVFVAPELFRGVPVLMIVDPETRLNADSLHMMVNAYDKDQGQLPIMKWVRAGELRYIDQKESPAILSTSGLQLPRVWKEARGQGRNIPTERNLVKSVDAYNKGLSDADAQTAADKLKAAGLQRLQIAKTIEDLPESGQKKIKSEGAYGVRGMYDPATDTTWLVQSNLTSVDDALFVGMHEGFHRGLRKTFGKEVLPILTLIHDSNERVARQTAAYMAAYKISRTEAIEEVLADMAGNDTLQDVKGWDNLLAFLRGALAKIANAMGVKMEFSDDQIRLLVAGIRRAGMADQVHLEPLVSATPTDQTESPAFRKWFGASRVVDEQGRPLVVYHGTRGDISSFDPAEGAALSPFNMGNRGIYFSADANYAGVYARSRDGTRQTDGGNIMPVYLSIKNPLVIPKGTKGQEAMSSAHVSAERIAELKNEGYDGIINHAAKEYVAFDPEQIKSAIGNNGGFDGGDSDIRFSRTEGPSQPSGWSSPEPTRTDRVIYELQDGRIDLKRVQEAIKKAGGDIEEKFDARLAETLYPGRVARRSEQFLDAEVKPLLVAMAKGNATMTELGDYLIARHAPERNAQIAKVNPDLPDGGAGRNSTGELMTDDAAAAYLANMKPERRALMHELAKHVDEITAGTRRLLVGEGLEKQSTVDAWTGAYKNYVPLFKDEAAGDNGMPPHPQGSGFTVKGAASKRSTGSTKEVTNVLAHVLMQREAAITRAEKNRVALSLYGMALANPNPAFWATIRPGLSNEQIGQELQALGVDPDIAAAGMVRAPTIRGVDPLTNKVVDRPNPIYKNLPGAITMKVNGEERVLMINTTDPRGQRMAEALKNLDGLTQMDLANSIVGKTTRWLAAVNTQYNPAFGLVNLVRDTLDGTVNLNSTELKGKSMRVLAQVPAAIKGIAQELAGGGTSNEWSRLFKQFQDDGGKTGFREMWRAADDRAKAIEKELASAQTAGKLTPGRAAHAALDLLDGFNTTLENAVRLSAYKTGLDNGLSRPAAARLARELTVDFNRKGRAGRELGPLYAFFNASVQGSARTFQTLKGPAGAKIIAGGLALGALQALMLAGAGYDDDDIPEFVKTRAFIIPILGGKEKRFVAIPMPLGLLVLPNTGRVLTELSLNGGKEIAKRAVSAIGEIANAFNPLGGGNIFTAAGALTTVAPTIVDPFVELGFNKNFAGNSIEKEAPRGESDNRPGYARAKESTQRSATGQVYLGISKAINTLTGGTPYEAGVASPTPERVQYIAQVAGGGVLRELEKAINASVHILSGEKVKSSAIPVLGRFYGEVDDDSVQQSRYYDKAKKLTSLETSLTAAKQAGDGEAMAKLIQDHPEVAMMKAQGEVQRELNKLNKAAVQVIGNPEQSKAIDDARITYMRAMNTAMKQMEDASGKLTLGQKLRGAVKPADVAAQ